MVRRLLIWALGKLSAGQPEEHPSADLDWTRVP